MYERHVMTNPRGQAERRGGKTNLIWFCLKNQTTQNSVKCTVWRVSSPSPNIGTTTVRIVKMNALLIFQAGPLKRM